jgi:hypothetical protein
LDSPVRGKPRTSQKYKSRNWIPPVGATTEPRQNRNLESGFPGRGNCRASPVTLSNSNDAEEKLASYKFEFEWTQKVRSFELRCRRESTFSNRAYVLSGRQVPVRVILGRVHRSSPAERRHVKSKLRIRRVPGS